MRRSILILGFAVLSACASAPETAVEQTPSAPVRPSTQRGLIGLTGQEVANKLGVVPTLHVREGNGTKLQFRSHNCVLDAYLYPRPQGGQPRVEHVDTRSPSGADRDEQQCLLDFQSAAN